MFRTLGLLLVATTLSVTVAYAEDPVMGSWEGRYLTKGWEGKSPTARVIGLGGDTYRMDLMTDTEVGKMELAGLRRGGAAAFVGQADLRDDKGVVVEVTAEMIEGKMTGRIHRKGAGDPFDIRFEMQKVFKASPTLGATPPEGAIVLFDGTSLDAWTLRPGNPHGGSMHIVSRNTMVSKQEVGDHKLHIEFRTPYMPGDRGQGRGNSGVYVLGRYEIQVLDSYGDDPADNLCGGIYRIATPAANACLPPGEWQTYDVTFHAARFNEAGEKTQNAEITVLHNGILIHDAVSLPRATPGGVSDKETETGPLLLQDHGDAVEYRNIWVQPLD